MEKEHQENCLTGETFGSPEAFWSNLSRCTYKPKKEEACCNKCKILELDPHGCSCHQETAKESLKMWDNIAKKLGEVEGWEKEFNYLFIESALPNTNYIRSTFTPETIKAFIRELLEKVIDKDGEIFEKGKEFGKREILYQIEQDFIKKTQQSGTGLFNMTEFVELLSKYKSDLKPSPE